MTSMDRTAKLLHGLDLTAEGIEVGPSFAPIAPKAKGFRTTVVDHASREDLVAKYRGHAVDTSRIEGVDVVWTDGSLADAVSRRNFFRWIIASHVIEHMPDFVGFLNGCDEALTDDGIVSLAVPDRRYCFDYRRPPTSLGAVVDAHHAQRRTHSPGTVAEHHLNAVLRDNAIAWSRGDDGPLTCVHSLDQVKHVMGRALASDEYIDCHAWVFTPSTFRLLVQDLHDLGLLSLQESCFFDSEGCEFIVQLSRNGSGPGLSRQELLERCRAEAGE